MATSTPTPKGRPPSGGTTKTVDGDGDGAHVSPYVSVYSPDTQVNTQVDTQVDTQVNTQVDTQVISPSRRSSCVKPLHRLSSAMETKGEPAASDLPVFMSPSQKKYQIDEGGGLEPLQPLAPRQRSGSSSSSSSSSTLFKRRQPPFDEKPFVPAGEAGTEDGPVHVGLSLLIKEVSNVDLNTGSFHM